MRSKQTLKTTRTRTFRSTRRPPARPRLRSAQATGPTGAAPRDRLVQAARMTLATRGFPGATAPLLKGTFLDSMLPTADFAYAAVALYFGIETLTHLDGDRSRAEALFDTAKQLAPIADATLASATWTGDKP